VPHWRPISSIAMSTSWSLSRRTIGARRQEGGGKGCARRFAMPFLFVVGNDPVELGLVKSLARPDGDATGLAIHTLAIGPKRFDILHQVVPNGTQFGTLLNPNFPERSSIGTSSRRRRARLPDDALRRGRS